MKLSKLLLLGLLSSGLLLTSCGGTNGGQGGTSGGESGEGGQGGSGEGGQGQEGQGQEGQEGQGQGGEGQGGQGQEGQGQGGGVEPAPKWIESTSAEILAAYQSKEEMPWNHFEGTYGDAAAGGVYKELFIAEDCVEGIWVVDETLSTDAVREISEELFMQDKFIFSSLPVDFVAEYYKSRTNEFKVHLKRVQENYKLEVEVVFDKYFACTDFVQATNDVLMISCHVTYSTVDLDSKWTVISATELLEAYQNKEAYPYTYFGGTYGDSTFPKNKDGSPVLSNVVEFLLDNKWVVDTQLSSVGMVDISEQLILQPSQIAMYVNPPEGYVASIKVFRGLLYKIDVNLSSDGGQWDVEAIYDRYFCCVSMILKTNMANPQYGYHTEQEMHIKWENHGHGGEVEIPQVKGKVYVFNKVVSSEGYDPSNLNTNFTIHFDMDGGIAIASVMSGEAFGLDHDFTSTALGTYEQNGREITYSLTGVEVKGLSDAVDGWQEYPPQAASYVTNLTGEVQNDGSINLQFYVDGALIVVNVIVK